jgi:hypothetical protein
MFLKLFKKKDVEITEIKSGKDPALIVCLWTPWKASEKYCLF